AQRDLEGGHPEGHRRHARDADLQAAGHGHRSTPARERGGPDRQGRHSGRYDADMGHGVTNHGKSASRIHFGEPEGVRGARRSAPLLTEDTTMTWDMV